jgi:hypothetical protein
VAFLEMICLVVDHFMGFDLGVNLSGFTGLLSDSQISPRQKPAGSSATKPGRFIG